MSERDRRKSIDWAKRMLATPGALILDTESTDKFPDSAEPVELSIVTMHGDVVFSSYLKPSGHVRIAPGAQAVHHISAEMVQDSPSIYDLNYELRQILESETVIIYNSGFDVPVLRNACRNYGVEPIVFDDQDLMLAAAAFVGEWSNYRHSYRWHKLGELCAAFHIQIEEAAHSSLGDCIRSLRLLEHMSTATT